MNIQWTSPVSPPACNRAYSVSYLYNISPYSSSDSFSHCSVPEEQIIQIIVGGHATNHRVQFCSVLFCTWTLKSMFVRTGRWWRACGGLKLFPRGAFGWSILVPLHQLPQSKKLQWHKQLMFNVIFIIFCCSWKFNILECKWNQLREAFNYHSFFCPAMFQLGNRFNPNSGHCFVTKCMQKM